MHTEKEKRIYKDKTRLKIKLWAQDFLRTIKLYIHILKYIIKYTDDTSSCDLVNLN